MKTIHEYSTEELCVELALRGGHPGAIGEALVICVGKTQDYNSEQATTKPEHVIRDDYFPFGLKSYAQMLHTKTQRLVSLALKDGPAVNESARDTCLDIVNYAGFAADWLKRSVTP